MDLSQLLIAARSPDPPTRKSAEDALGKLREQNLGLLLLSLCAELATEGRDPLSRRLAGLILKNHLTSQDEIKAKQLGDAWIAIDGNVREQIKNGLLHTLASPVGEARHTSAQVVAKVANIELPSNLWPTLLDFLLKATLESPDENAKQAALEALGYVCEEVDGAALQSHSNKILTAVVSAMRKEVVNPQMRKTGVTAFYNALEFVRPNFERKEDRDYMMGVVCEGTMAKEKDLRVAFYECLVKIAQTYYEFLPAYMPDIFNLTLNAIKSDPEEEVQLQGVEFWCTICDREIELTEDLEEANEAGGPPPAIRPANYIAGALKFLVAVLTEALTKQKEDALDQDWNLPSAAGTCLALISQTVRDAVVVEVMPFVQANINNPNWRLREAATLAFGAILEGPTTHIQQLISQAIPILLDHMKDQSVMVQDTTAWTLGRVCQCHPESVSDQLPRVMEVFLHGLNDPPRVAVHIAWAIHNLAESYTDEFNTSPTGPLSPYFGNLLQSLITSSDRKEAAEHRFRASAYEAMNALITASSLDALPTLAQAIPIFLERLTKTFTMPVLNQEERDEQVEWQSLLCSVLLSIYQRLGDKVKPWADQMMLVFLQVLGFKNATLHEEAFMAIGALANCCEAEFDRYLPHLHPFLLRGLMNWQETQVCITAVGVVGDLCRAVGDKILPFTDQIMEIFIQNLGNPELQRDVKPLIMGTFGDIALAINGNFEKYMAHVMPILAGASGVTYDPEDQDMVDHINELREGILEAYTGIIQAMRVDNKNHNIAPFMDHIFRFIEAVWRDKNHSSALLRVAVGCLGDLGHCMEAAAKPYFMQDWVRHFIPACQKDKNKVTKENSRFAKQVLDALSK